MWHYLEQAAKPLSTPLSRRGFLATTGGVGVGLVVGFALPRGAAAATGDGQFSPFVRIGTDGTVTVLSKHLDKGQGTASGLTTLVADELDASIGQMRTEHAPADAEVYKNLLFGVQGTGGSTAIANSFEQYRKAGAAAKAMLVAAAAKAWNVPANEITVSDGVVSHNAGKSADFGALAEAASAMEPPADPVLKSPDEWVYIGKTFPRVDIPNKTVGAPRTYGLDIDIENRLVAVIARPPKFGATLSSFDATEAKGVRGVVDVRETPAGVVVFAESTWPAIKARDLLAIEWDETNAETRGTTELLEEYRALAETPGAVARAGDFEAGLADADAVVEMDYAFPFLAHAPMEPIDITILFDGETATLWTGSQIQTIDQGVTAQILGLTPDKVAINTAWAGGSFGRRATYTADYAAEAAMVAQAWGEPRPIKIVWTREDDIKGGYYRPMYVHKVRAGVKDGKIAAWHHRIVGQSILTGTMFESFAVHDGIDHSSVEGVVDTTYTIPNMHVELHSPKVGIPTLWWRSVGHTHTAYVMETMMDALAKAANADPVAFRLAHLDQDPRKAGVLELAAEKAGWGAQLPEGRHRGVAVHKSFNSYVAEIAEISMDGDTMKVEKVVAAVDCGIAINPDNVAGQVEGGLGYGLGAALRNEITLTDGVVDQANFDTYEPLRIDDMPDVEVHIVPSTEAPTGIGEPGTPPVAPAVANAVGAATGQTPTELPWSKGGLV